MTKKKTKYIVANPRNIPDGKYIFRQGDKRWFEGDVYDGGEPEEPLRRGFIVEAD